MEQTSENLKEFTLVDGHEFLSNRSDLNSKQNPIAISIHSDGNVESTPEISVTKVAVAQAPSEKSKFSQGKSSLKDQSLKLSETDKRSGILSKPSSENQYQPDSELDEEPESERNDNVHSFFQSKGKE